jgi:hypothetical protein
MVDHLKEEISLLDSEIDEAVQLHENLESILSSYSINTQREREVISRLEEVLSQSENDISEAKQNIEALKESI